MATTSWVREIASAIVGVLGGDALKATFAQFLGKTAEHAGEPLGKNAGAWLSYQIFGPNSEDERRYTEAELGMDESESALLNHRLAQPDIDANWYRICVASDDVNIILQKLERHAQMSDEQWKDFTTNLGIRKDAADRLIAKFGRALKRGGVAFLKGLQSVSTGIEATGLPDDVKKERDGLRAWKQKHGL